MTHPQETTREVLEQAIPNEVVRSALHATGDGPFGQSDYDDMRASLEAAFLGMQQVAGREALAHHTPSTTGEALVKLIPTAEELGAPQVEPAPKPPEQGDTHHWPQQGDPAPSTAGERDMHARFKAKHQFLEWNRAQPEPLVKIAHEYGVFDKAVSLYAALLQSTADHIPDAGEMVAALPVGELTEMHLLDTPEPDKYVDCGEGRPLPMFHLSTLLQYGARLAAASSQPVREPLTPDTHYQEWKHGCESMCTNITLWLDRCPHCGKPRPVVEAAHGITKKGAQ